MNVRNYVFAPWMVIGDQPAGSQVASPAYLPSLNGMRLLGGPRRRIELGPGVLAAPWLFQAFVCAAGTCSAGGATHTLWLDASL